MDAPDDTPKGRPQRGRKRKIPQQSRQDRKRLYNNNKTHINTRGKIVHEKIFNENFACSCRKKCTNIVRVDLRKRFFTQFWSMGTFAGRCVFLLMCVSENGNEKYKYKIFGQEVCKRALTGILQINERRISLALKKMNCDTYEDGRGKTTGGKNALPPHKREEIRAHIASFPKYISHYCRNVTDSKFLRPDLNLGKMYEIYKIKFQNPVSRSVYKRVFYEEFNLRFKTPKKDTCKRCDIFGNKIKTAVGLERSSLVYWHNSHLDQAEMLTNLMKADLEEAKINPFLETLTYDMQKTLASPRITTSIAYYLRQLNLYNFGIHVGSSGKGLFHLWLETEGSKGTQEVGSCLKKFIEGIAEPVQKLILWSDSCGGQNRSIRLVLMLIYVLHHHPSLNTISLRYLQSGHSFLPNDSEFGDFECSLKNKESVFTDLQYMQIMKECRLKNQFEVNRMFTNKKYLGLKRMRF